MAGRVSKKGGNESNGLGASFGGEKPEVPEGGHVISARQPTLLKGMEKKGGLVSTHEKFQ